MTGPRIDDIGQGAGTWRVLRGHVGIALAGERTAEVEAAVQGVVEATVDLGQDQVDIVLAGAGHPRVEVQVVRVRLSQQEAGAGRGGDLVLGLTADTEAEVVAVA